MDEEVARRGETTRPAREYRRQKQETGREDRGATHYLQEPESVSLHHAAISLGAGLGQGAGLVLHTHRHPHIHHRQFHHCPVVVYGVTFQSSVVNRLGGPRHFIRPCSVVFFDAVELAQCSGGVRAGQLQGRSRIVRVFCCGHLCPPWPSLDYHPERCRFLSASVRCHPAGWSLRWLVHSLQTALLRDITVLPRGPTHAVFGVAHVSTIRRSNCPTPALPRLCRL